jgi:beta-mannanase
VADQTSRRRTGVVVTLLLAAVAVFGAGHLPGTSTAPAQSAPARSPAPWPVQRDPRARVLVGVTTKQIASNSFRRWAAADLDSVNRFEHQVRKHAGIVLWYADWARVARPSLTQLRLVAARQSVPEITWEPWDSVSPEPSRQPRYRLRRIIGGAFDPYIRRWARDLAAYGGPVRLRFAHEMNAGFYPWAEGVNGNRPGEYVRAWRHVRRIFDRAGARNVRWVWSPVAAAVQRSQYPGDRYVDIAGLSGFVGGSQLRTHRWRSFGRVFGAPLAKLARIAPSKAVEISEVGASEQGGDKAAWIRGMFRVIQRRRQITAVNWFNMDQASDWRVATTPRARRAFAAGVAAPVFGQRPPQRRRGARATRTISTRARIGVAWGARLPR